MSLDSGMRLPSTPLYVPTPSPAEIGSQGGKIRETRPKPPPAPSSARTAINNSTETERVPLTYSRALNAQRQEQTVAYKEERHEVRLNKLNNGLNEISKLSDALGAVSNKQSWLGKHIQYLKSNWSQNYGKILLGLAVVGLGVAASIMTGGLAPLAALGGAALVKVATFGIAGLVGGVLVFGKTFGVRGRDIPKTSQPQVDVRQVRHSGSEAIVGNYQKAFKAIDKSKSDSQVVRQQILIAKHVRSELVNNRNEIQNLRNQQLHNPAAKDQIQREINYLEEKEIRLKEIFDNLRGISNLRKSSSTEATPSEVNKKKILLKGALVALANVQQNNVRFANRQNPQNQSSLQVVNQALNDIKDELNLQKKDIKNFTPKQTNILSSFLTPFTPSSR